MHPWQGLDSCGEEINDNGCVSIADEQIKSTQHHRHLLDFLRLKGDSQGWLLESEGQGFERWRNVDEEENRA